MILRKSIMNKILFMTICFMIPFTKSNNKDDVLNQLNGGNPNLDNIDELKTLLISENEESSLFPLCSNLRIGQYTCDEPIQDPETLEFQDCNVDRVLLVNCSALEAVNCTGDRIFTQSRSCYYTYVY